MLFITESHQTKQKVRLCYKVRNELVYVGLNTWVIQNFSKTNYWLSNNSLSELDVSRAVLLKIHI
jgi:hypothetical protein